MYHRLRWAMGWPQVFPQLEWPRSLPKQRVLLSACDAFDCSRLGDVEIQTFRFGNTIQRILWPVDPDLSQDQHPLQCGRVFPDQVDVRCCPTGVCRSDWPGLCWCCRCCGWLRAASRSGQHCTDGQDYPHDRPMMVPFASSSRFSRDGSKSVVAAVPGWMTLSFRSAGSVTAASGAPRSDEYPFAPQGSVGSTASPPAEGDVPEHPASSSVTRQVAEMMSCFMPLHCRVACVLGKG